MKEQKEISMFYKVDIMVCVRNMINYSLLGYSKVYDYNTDKPYVKIGLKSYSFRRIDEHLVVV